MLSPVQTNVTEFVLPSEDFDTIISEQRKASSPTSTSPSQSSGTPESKLLRKYRGKKIFLIYKKG